jgi:hypothetical protein
MMRNTLPPLASNDLLDFAASIEFQFLNGNIVLEKSFESVEASLWCRLLLEPFVQLRHCYLPIRVKTNDEHVAVVQAICFAADSDCAVDRVM